MLFFTLRSITMQWDCLNNILAFIEWWIGATYLDGILTPICKEGERYDSHIADGALRLKENDVSDSPVIMGFSTTLLQQILPCGCWNTGPLPYKRVEEYLSTMGWNKAMLSWEVGVAPGMGDCARCYPLPCLPHAPFLSSDLHQLKWHIDQQQAYSEVRENTFLPQTHHP